MSRLRESTRVASEARARSRLGGGPAGSPLQFSSKLRILFILDIVESAPRWWNGRHTGLRSQRRKALWVQIPPSALYYLKLFMRESPRPIIESAETAYDRLHQLAEEEQVLFKLHEELHTEAEESKQAEAHAHAQIQELCNAIARRGVDRERAVERIEALYRIIDARKLQMEKIKQDLAHLRGMENDLEEKLRAAARIILPEAKA